MTSILAASSNSLVPKCHRTSALSPQSRSTPDTVFTIHWEWSQSGSGQARIFFLFIFGHQRRPLALLTVEENREGNHFHLSLDTVLVVGDSESEVQGKGLRNLAS
jgi:hypothetical protein